MFNYCPSCASKNIDFNKNKFTCPDCGFVYYHNTAAATGCLIRVPPQDGMQDGDRPACAGRLLFTVRGKDPGKGLLDIPGGFVDPGEGMLEGIYRELREEIGWTPEIPSGKPLADVFKLFASFSNVYPYKGYIYNTCDVYFTVTAPNLSLNDLHPQNGEIEKILLLKPQDIDFNKFAFDSVKKAVELYLGSGF